MERTTGKSRRRNEGCAENTGCEHQTRTHMVGGPHIRDFMHRRLCQMSRHLSHWEESGDWPVPWKLCITSSICVLFSTLVLTRRAPQTPCIKSTLTCLSTLKRIFKHKGCFLNESEICDKGPVNRCVSIFLWHAKETESPVLGCPSLPRRSTRNHAVSRNYLNQTFPFVHQMIFSHNTLHVYHFHRSPRED